MADHGHHDPGGHELEALNTKLLFRLLLSLSAVTLLATIAVVQWFHSQRRELEYQYAAEGSYMLADYKTKMSADLEGIDRVAASMLADPALLHAPPPPPGWIHPDDLVGAAAAAPADAPADGEPAGDEPTGDEPAEPTGDEPAEPVEDNQAADEPVEQPASENPADEQPADEKPADDKPAEAGDN